MRSSIFRLDSVSVASEYGVKLSDFTLEIREGEMLGVIGPSNSGKTSLCHVLTGQERRCQGKIFYRNQPMTEDKLPKNIAKRVALINSSSTLAPSLKVSELLALVNPRRGRQLFVNQVWIRYEAQQVLRQLSIAVDVDTRARELTLGQRHLILIAEACLQRADLIILNNTVSGYTEQEWEAIRKTLEIVLRRDMAVLLTSNQETRLVMACHRIAVLDQGTNLKVMEPSQYSKLHPILTYRQGVRPFSGFRRQEESEAIFSAEELHTRSLDGGCFSLRRGEIVGFYDPGNETDQEMFGALMRMDRSCGRFVLEGQPLPQMDVGKCLGQGIGFIPDGAVEHELFLQLSVIDNILCASSRKLGPWFLMRQKEVEHLTATCARIIGIPPHEMSQKTERFDSLARLRIYLCRWMFVRVKLMFCLNLFETVDPESRQELRAFLHSLTEKGAAVGLFGYDRTSLLDVCDSFYVMEHGQIGPRLGREEAKQLFQA